MFWRCAYARSWQYHVPCSGGTCEAVATHSHTRGSEYICCDVWTHARIWALLFRTIHVTFPGHWSRVTFPSCCSGIGGSLVPITVLCHHGAGQQRRARFPAGAQTCAVQCKLHWNAGNFSVSGWRGLSAATLSSRLTDLPICSSMVP